MILTVTPNPSMDRTVEVPGFSAGGTFGARLVSLRPAGKGVNVSRCLAALSYNRSPASPAPNQPSMPAEGLAGRLRRSRTIILEALGAESIATGLVGRDAAPEFRADLAESGIETAFVETASRVRTSTTVIDPGSEVAAPVVTHIRERGDEVSRGDVKALQALLAERSPAGGWVAACGSLPKGIPARCWAELLLVARRRGARVALDSSGEGLAAARELVPDLLKPNRQELAELLGREVASREEALDAARSLVGTCARMVLVTLGRQGAMLVGEGRALIASSEPERVVSSVGAGDAALAGYLWAETNGKPPEDCLRAAVAAGTASVAEPYAGALDRGRFERLFERTSVETL